MHNIFKDILAIPRPAKRSILIATDVVLLIGALWLSFSLRLDNWYWPLGGVNNPIVLLVVIAPVFAVPIFAQFGLYRAIIRYLGMRATWSIVKAVAVYAVLWGLVVFLSGIQGVPRSIVLINAMVALLAIGGSRMGARWLLRKIEDSFKIDPNGINIRASHQSRVVIYGAGAAGRQLAFGLGQSRECILLAFVDDSVELQGRDLMDVPILSQEKLRVFVADQRIDDIFLAIPSITSKQRNLIIEGLRPLSPRIRTLPGLIEMARGKVDYSALLDLDINDLLSRDPAEPDEAMLQEQVSKATIMVTGAGGSIGSELCRQILRRKPNVLLLFELSEFALYTLHNELLDSIHYLAHQKRSSAEFEIFPDIIPLLGSVSDENRVSDIMQTWKPSIIYHAAAIKHVPIVEQNIAECIKINVLGTLVMAKVAAEQQVKRFILISTDKAVNPTNAMGASKRCCEMILQALAEEQLPSFDFMPGGKHSSQVALKTQFAIVRFGNVLDSSGSVVPRFRKQIAQGGPITLTHQDITRYFMTIPEAAQLVMQTGAMVGNIGQGIGSYRNQHVYKGADVYVLDMGDPVKVYDLACRMVEISGFKIKDNNSPEGDIAIEVVGLRPGEKLYEELLIGNNPKKTGHPRIMKAREKYLPWDELRPILQTLQVAALNGDVMMIRAIFKNLVPEYMPDEEISDWVYKEQLK
jgi:FlaA1/EpsC-like NDP-sugar epimerase